MTETFGISNGEVRRRRKPQGFTREISANTRKRMEAIMLVISKNPGCSQKDIVSAVKPSAGTVKRDISALERRALVTVVRTGKKFQPHQHALSAAGERYVGNLK